MPVGEQDIWKGWGAIRTSAEAAAGLQAAIDNQVPPTYDWL